MQDSIFRDLFVLELANNHQGSFSRGLKIVERFSRVMRRHEVKAAIKLQIRDVGTFIHKDHRADDTRYIRKTIATELTKDAFKTLAEAIRASGCLRMATPFDEASVLFCRELNMDLIKIASSDVGDWPLIEAIAKLKKPVIASTGGTTEKQVDDLVTFFRNRRIPLAINHCVSIYPTPVDELELNQIDYLRERYPENVIGFSSHQSGVGGTAMAMAYAKGARTFERHIDLEGDTISPYCITPGQADAWVRSYLEAKSIAGTTTGKRLIPEKETVYLRELHRGMYAKRDLEAGELLTPDNYYLAVPLTKGQASCKDLSCMAHVNRRVKKDEPIYLGDGEIVDPLSVIELFGDPRQPA